jgi:hypothetical protein
MAFLTVFWIWSRVSFFGFIFTSLRQKAGDDTNHALVNDGTELRH